MKKLVGLFAVALLSVSCTVENNINTVEPIKQDIEDFKKPVYVDCSVESNLTENSATLYLIDWSQAEPDTIKVTETENKFNIKLVKRRFYEVIVQNSKGAGGSKDKFNEITVKMSSDTLFHIKTGNYSAGCSGQFMVKKINE